MAVLESMRIRGKTGYLKFVDGTVSLFDAEDVDVVESERWFSWRSGRDVPYIGTNKSKYLHRLIMQKYRSMDGLDTDHINQNPLDNRKANLRAVPEQVNLMNKRSYKNNTSGYRGVSHQNGRYRAIIGHLDRKYHIGYFDTPEEAAVAFDKKAIELRRENALPRTLNFPRRYKHYLTQLNMEGITQ